MKQSICKCCFKTINKPTLVNILNDVCLCEECFKSFDFNLVNTTFENYPFTYLTTYKKPLSTYLIQYKETLDYELKDIFFNYYCLYIKLKYFSYHIVLVPSSESKIKKRGFNHLKCMCDQFNLPYLDVLYKDDTLDQKKKNINQRKNVSKYIHIKNGELIKDKKILIIDDVFTTGNSIKASINLIKPYKPKKIKILVLCKDVKCK